jgi:hypothetical protein
MSLSLAQAQWLIGFMRNLPGSHAPRPSEEDYAAAMAAQAAQASAAQLPAGYDESSYGYFEEEF